jgi:hypothetical protein
LDCPGHVRVQAFENDARSWIMGIETEKLGTILQSFVYTRSLPRT